MKKTELRTIFSANLKRLLKTKKINRRELSENLNIAYSRICDWSRARTLPTENEMLIIANFFDVSTDELTKDINIQVTNSNSCLAFNDDKQKIRIYDLESGNIIGHDEVCYEYFDNNDALHISFLVSDDLLYPKYSINDLVLVEHIWKPTNLDEGDYLITKDKQKSLFIHIFNKKESYIIAPLNNNNSKGVLPFEISKDEIHNYNVYKAVAVTKKI